MDERIRFVGAASQHRIPFTGLCSLFGISTKTGYKWLHRFDEEGAEGLHERSRRPHRNSRAVPERVEERLVALRHAHPTWGPRKLLAWLSEKEPQWELPVASTVGDLLKRRGFVRARIRRHRAPARTSPLRHATAPNVLWTMDFKGWFRLGDGSRCDPLTVGDAYSRFSLCLRALTDQSERSTWTALEDVFREYGLPEAFRVDNGQPWAAAGGLGLTRLSVKLLKLGIEVERIDPGRPDQNGRHERFHLTVQEETARPPAATRRHQQRKFDAFRQEFNEERPHEALGQRPPARYYYRSSKRYPSRLPEVTYPSWFETRTIKHKGYLVWRGVEIYVSQALNSERVGLLEVEEGCREVYFGRMLLGRIHDGHLELGLVAPPAPELLPMSPV